jgi:hypothetical protein
MSGEGSLARIQRWYLDCCDGEWEHDYGVTIESLDNPGWRVHVDLRHTPLDDRDHESAEVHRSEADWLVTRRDGSRWEAACGPLNLDEALEAFLAWAE